MSKFLLPILAGVAMVIISGCGGAASGSDDAKIAAQMEARRVAKLLTDETTACGGTCAGYAEWLTANPDLLTVPIVEGDHATTNNMGHYLQGTATGLNTGDVEDAVVTTVTFMDVAKSDNAFKDDDDNTFDGFAYFGEDADDGNDRRYAGILSNTNMGAPLTTPVGRSIWKAFISSGEGIIIEGDDFATPTAFDLTVNFNATGGTINAFIPTSLAQIAFRIDGEFNAKGVITGTTSRRVYRDNTDVSTYEASSFNINTVGTLRGLIGSDGAVGVFTTDAAGAREPYSGGFVAKFAPLLPAPDHALYVSAFSPPPAVADLTQSTVTFELAQPTAEGFSTTGLRFGERPGRNPDCNTCVNNLIARLGGNNADDTDTDGIALFYGRFTNGTSARLRAGLLPGTDLGASFGNVASDGATTANWPGTIYHTRHVSGAKPNQVFTPFRVAFAVDFAAGTFELPRTVLVPGEPSLITTIRVAGRFGEHAEAVEARLPLGVLGGIAYHQIGINPEIPHDVQGLIGTEGAVGVFRNSTRSSFGGFVARAVPARVNHAGYLAQNPTLRTTASGNTAFVQGLANSLDTSGVNFITPASHCANNSRTGCIENYLARLNGDNADINDPSGFAFFHGNSSPTRPFNDPIYRIGLLSGTDVGFALPALAPDGTASAVWRGKLHTTVAASSVIEEQIPKHNLALTVNYSNRTLIGGPVTISNDTLSFNARYGLTGVISGTVTHDRLNSPDEIFNLIGLIGTEGAIGIFESRSIISHVGGFIVKPPATP